MVVLFTKTDERHKVFNLEGNKDEIIRELQSMIGADPEDEDYGINTCDMDTDFTRPTEAERAAEEEEIKALIVEIQEGNKFEEWFNKIPTKKNGTFAKGRVTPLWRGGTFQKYYEGSYGYNAPELVIRTNDDLTATLQVESRIEKW